MPFVNVRTLRGALTAEQKQELQRRITDVMVDIEGAGNKNFRQFVWVMIEEEDPANWSLGGVTPSLELLDAVRKST
ncbi:MAG: 4-oxalocrotonate tautomerase family protein [Dehalococcoidia bacterium]|nr:MAG: 4-oxalocrotonate tautomerase family protein [Dehalococcoidia bacterium]